VASSSSPQRAQSRRALIADIKQDKRTWLKHGAAALAVSVLGLGVAASASLTGSAQSSAPQNSAAQSSAASAGLPMASTDRPATQSASRNSDRPPLDARRLKSLADQRAEELKKTDEEIAAVANAKSAKARSKALESASAATRRRAAQLAGNRSITATDRSAATAEIDTPPVASGGKSCLPVARGYSIAARFGQVGSWSRYHTGIDFSAAVGTPLRASASGVVTNAGIGQASGWAGNYVAIKHADGTQTMMAHMSRVSVSEGQTVSACQVVGAIGMTGRTFGPHVHFEVYPAGVTPGDLYKAENPASWLGARHLKP